jgi:hypothetical protein
MSHDTEGSVTPWIGALKAGDDQAAQRLWMIRKIWLREVAP